MMGKEPQNPYLNVLKDLFEEIDRVEKSGATAATVCMVYIRIDSMAYLGMPLGRYGSKPPDFVGWVDTYLKTEGTQPYQYRGIDVWEARSGLLHTYAPTSRAMKKQSVKIFGYHNGSEHMFNPSISEELVMISIPRLVKDFFDAVSAFFRDAVRNPDIKARIDSRILRFYQRSLLRDK